MEDVLQHVLSLQAQPQVNDLNTTKQITKKGSTKTTQITNLQSTVQNVKTGSYIFIIFLHALYFLKNTT